jgi:hypothetical protein
MNKESVIDALVTLANGLENRSKIAQLREIYPYIEEAKRAGFKNLKIVETLNAQGFELTLKSFEMLLYRIREETKAAANASRNSPSPAHFQSEKGTRQSQSTTSIPSSNWSTGQGSSASPSGLPPKPNATGPTVGPDHESEDNATGSSNPQDLNKITNSTPNLAELAKIGKRKPK